MPSLIEQLLPRQPRHYSDAQLETVYEFFQLCLRQYGNIDRLVEIVGAEDWQYLTELQTRLIAQNALPRAAARRDYLILNIDFIQRMLRIKEERETRAREAAMAEQLQAAGAGLYLINKTKPIEEIFKDITDKDKPDILNNFLEKDRYFNKFKEIDSKYLNNFLNLVHRHDEEEEQVRRELVRNLRRLAINNVDLLRAEIHEIQNRPGHREEHIRLPAAKPAQRKQINTHTATIHKDASDSALRLQKDFPANQFRPGMANIDWVFVGREGNKFCAELMRMVRSELDEDETVPDFARLERSIRRALQKALRDSSFKDPASDISLSDALKSLLVAINSLEADEIKKDAYLQLCKALYLLQEEYPSLAVGTEESDNSSCPPGLFNGIIYSQATTLPNHVIIRMQSKAHAAIAVGDRMQSLALDILRENDFTDHEEFAAAVIAQSKTAAVEIVREVVIDFYAALGYPSAEAAQSDIEANPDRIDVHCKVVCHCGLDDLFSFFPIDFERMFDDMKGASAGVAKPRPTPPSL